MKSLSEFFALVAAFLLWFLPNQAEAYHILVECDYYGPVIDGTPNSGLVCELTWGGGRIFGVTLFDYSGHVVYTAQPSARDDFSSGGRLPLSISTPQPQMAWLSCTGFTGLHQIFMTATSYKVHIGGINDVYYTPYEVSSELTTGSIVAFPCGAPPIGSSG